MKLKEVLDHLTFNELSQHRIGGYSGGRVADADIPKILSTINQGTEAINIRVNLLVGFVRVNLSSTRTNYVMDKVNSVGAERYIIDDNFTNKFRQIIGVTSSNGENLVTNNRNNNVSLGHPSYNTFQVPSPLEGDFVWVEYEYDPESLVATTYAEASLLDYPLPHFTTSALYAYVAAKMEEGSVMQEVLAKNANVYSRFEYEIAQIKTLNVLSGDTYFTDSKFYMNGWR